MTILIFSAKKNAPSLIAQATRSTLQKLYPDQTVDYSETFDIADLHSDKRFTFVLPGAMLYDLHWELTKSGARDRCITEVKDNHHHFIGFCAGAFYGAENLVAAKDCDEPFTRFNHDTSRRSLGDDFSLGMIEKTTALGPFKPYDQAEVGRFGCYTQAVTLQAGEHRFNSLYIEGPLFFNHDLSGPYDKQDCIVANYQLDYQPELELVHNRKTSTIKITAPIPAVLHDEVKGSHRYLIGPHPELSSTVRTFLPALEKQFAPYLAKLPSQDRTLLLNEQAENENVEFLRRTFKI